MCPSREKCYRYTAPANDKYQTYGKFNREADADNCVMFWDNGIFKKNNMEKETVCGKLPDNMGFPHFKTGIVDQPNEIPNKENGKVYKDQHGREFLQTEHGRIILTKQTRHLFDNINEQ
jgi:hypothetical protein